MAKIHGTQQPHQTSYGTGLAEFGTNIKKGAMSVCIEGSQVLFTIYSVKGLTKFTKAMIANLKFIERIASIKGAFDKCLEELCFQRDIYYALMVVGSMKECIKVKKDGTFTTQLPRDKKTNKVDYGLIFSGIGNVCETGKFLQKNAICAFSTCTRIANRLGSIKVFNTTFGNIPVLNSFCDRPKDFFIFFACWFDLAKIFREPQWDFESYLKISSAVGKILLISLGFHFYKATWFLVIDVITQNSSFLSLFPQQAKAREKFLTATSG